MSQEEIQVYVWIASVVGLFIFVVWRMLREDKA